MKQPLPLSWRHINDSHGSALDQSLSLGSRHRFIPYADTPTLTLENLLVQDSLHPAQNILLRGVPHWMCKSLSKDGFQSIQSGLTASCCIDRFSPAREVVELSNYANKHFDCAELEPQQYLTYLANAWDSSRHASKPRLEHLFRYNPRCLDNVFVATARNSGKLGAIVSFSKMADGYFHLEQFVRTHHATRGAMELLITYALESLKSKQHAHYLSLGEVPFYSSHKIMAPIFQAYRHLVKARYSASGLFRFKNKFNPNWEPVYWSGSSLSSLSKILTVARISNAIKLLHGVQVKE